MGLFSKQSAIAGQIDVITNLASITNWDQVGNLCETVNAKDDGAKEAGKALRKKLRLGRPQQQMNAITLIQAMVDGCGSKFKAQLATAKFAEDIEAVVIADATDANVKIRLMERLEDWSVTFATDPGLVIIPQLYYSLVKHNTPRSQMRQMAQDIELARNNAHMLTEAISFADPELEAIEENELIKEFHSKCMTLQRGIQQYLSEMTESANPNEQWLTCNQELVQAFTAYNQMMERQHLSKVTKASEMVDVVPTRSAENSPNGLRNPQDLMSFNDGNGAGVGGKSVGNGHTHSNGNGVSTGNGKSMSASPTGPLGSVPTQTASADPFSDEPYFVTGPADVAAAVKMGKRTDNQDKIFDASAFFRQQQLEQEQLQALKENQRILHEQQQIGGGSSQAAPIGTIPVSTLP
ncbi:putative actin patch assembly and actin polymerization protein [Mortierella claussenii]|nr:putative actin patch assembly and actin polymerization protein [Mortierella claussenii]